MFPGRFESKNSYEDVVNQTLSMIFSNNYAEGYFKKLLDGGIETIIDGVKVPTGIIIVPPIENLIEKYRDINWQFLFENRGIIKNARMRSIIKQAYFTLIKKYPEYSLFQKSEPDKYSTLYTNTYKRIPEYAKEASIKVDTLLSYGIPGLYTSPVAEENGKFFSECTKDIILDRKQSGIDYNRGVLITGKVTEKKEEVFFYIDRKINIVYLNTFIRKILLKKEFSNFAPSEESIKQLSNKTLELYNTLSQTTTNNKEKLQAIIEFCAHESFSIIGFLLFEIVHEFFTQFGYSVYDCNQILRQFDESQNELWSMRAFKLKKYSDISKVLESLNNNKILPQDLESWIVEELFDRMPLFIGDNHENLEECSFNSLFSKQLYELEKFEKRIDLYTAKLEEAVEINIPDDLKVILTLAQSHNTSYLRFNKKLNRNEEDRLVNAQTNENARRTIQEILKTQYLKLCYFHVKESFGAANMRFLANQKGGFIAAPLQPDTRGEFLLIPYFNESEIECSRVRLIVENDKVELLDRLEGFKFDLGIRNYSDYDNSLFYSISLNYEKGQIITTNKEKYLFKHVQENLYLELVEKIKSLKLENYKDKPFSVITLPFFKEDEPVSNIIKSLNNTYNLKDEYQLLLLVSNLDRRSFFSRMTQLENDLIGTNIRKNLLIVSLNSEGINEINLWHSNKFLSVKLGIDLVKYLTSTGLEVKGLLSLEANILNFDDFAEVFRNAEFDSEEIALPCYKTQVKNEGESIVYTDDNCATPLEQILVYPITKLYLDLPLPNLYGGVFWVGKKYISELESSSDETLSKAIMIEASLIPLLKKNNFRQIYINKRDVAPSITFLEKYYIWMRSSIESLFIGIDSEIKTSRVTLSPENLCEKLILQKLNFEEEQIKSIINETIRLLNYYSQIYKDFLSKSLNADILKVLDLEVGSKEIFAKELLRLNIWNRALKELFDLYPKLTEVEKNDLLLAFKPLFMLCVIKAATQNQVGWFDDSSMVKEIKDKSTRVFTVSDLHSRIDLFKIVLDKNNLIDDEVISLKENEYFIINGDSIDFFFKGEYDKDIDLEAKQLSEKYPLDWAYEIINGSHLSTEFDSYFRKIVYKIYSGLPVWHLPIKESLERKIYFGYEEYFIPYDNNSYIFRPDLLPEEIKSDEIKQLFFKSALAFDIGELRRSLIGGLSSFLTLKFLYNSWEQNGDKIIIQLGNHEADWLSGKWQFRSLQKNFLSMLVFQKPGLSVLEKKDFDQSKQRYGYGEILDIQNTLEGGEIISSKLAKKGILFWWLWNKSSAIISTHDTLFVHGGITKDLLRVMSKEEYKNLNVLMKFNSQLIKDKNEYSFKKGLLSSSGEGSILSPDAHDDFLYNNLREVLLLLKGLGLKRIAVGHNAYLGLTESADEIIKELSNSQLEYRNTIQFIGKYIIKLDVALKDGNDKVQVLVINTDGKVYILGHDGISSVYSSELEPIMKSEDIRDLNDKLKILQFR